MRTLLWKEFRERRVLGSLWAISITLVFGIRLNWYGDGEGFNAWLLLPMLLSFVLGGMAYSTELKENRIDFLYSQPIAWTKLLLAKVLFGLVVVLGSTILAAVIFVAFSPDYYNGLGSSAELARDVVKLAWWVWTLYLSGLFFSVVLPGVVGTLAVLVLCTLPLIVISEVAYDRFPASSMDMFEVGKSCALLIGPGIAALMLLRFGLSLPAGVRVIRYLLVVLLACIVVPGLFMLVPKDFVASRFCNKGCDWSSVGPGGECALIHYRWRLNLQTGIALNSCVLREGYYMTRLSDGKAVPVEMDLPQDGQFFWADSQTIYFYSPGIGAIQFLRLTTGGRLVTHNVKTAGVQPHILPSSDGKYAIMASQGAKGVNLELMNTRGAGRLEAVAEETTAYWWQSGRQIRYIDDNGKQHTLDLSHR